MRRAFIFADKGKDKVLKGLRPALKTVFWDNYDYEESTYRKKGGTGVKYRSEGLHRGEYVHKQIEDYINFGTKEFLAKYETIHPYTKKVIGAMKEWKLKPCRAEFILYDLRARVGTKIDALLLDPCNDFALVDWKCGFDDYILKGNGMLNGPLSGYSNCPLHQAYLQVLFEAIFLKKHYNFFVKNLYVIQITLDGIIPYIIPPAFIEKSDELYDYFCVTLENQRQVKRLLKERQRTRKTRKRKKNTKSSPQKKKKKE